MRTAEAARTIPNDADLRTIIARAVELLAQETGVVIVAHAASRLAASGGGDADKAIRDEDEARADYLKRFYGVEQELPTHYDVVVNTDVLDPAAAADIVIAAVVQATATAAL